MAKKVNSTKVVVLQGKVDAVGYVATKGFPEVGQFADEKSLQKFYKQLDTASLEEWAKLEGLTYKACPESEPIHRMRVAMAILYKHFPKETKAAKPESPYKKYSTEDLIAMAVEKGLAVDVCDDMRIMRMRCIMALRLVKAL